MRSTTSAFTLVEVLIAFAVLATLSIMVSELLVSETKQTSELSEDLRVNKEARLVFQLLSRDVRGSTEIVMPKPESQVIDVVGDVPDLLRDPPDPSRAILTLRRSLPTDGPERLQIDYYLVGPAGPPAGMGTKSTIVRNAKAKRYSKPGGSETMVYPLVRSVSIVGGAGGARVEDDAIVAEVTGLAFYQRLPPTSTVTAPPVSPTVYVSMVLSTFKRLPAGTFMEGYREKFSSGFTARAVVTSGISRPPGGP